jgi:lysophospholipase L1-like esterase
MTSAVLRLATSLGVFVMLFLGFEGYLRLTFEVHDPGEASCDIYSETLLWSTKPNCDGSNSRGYRDFDHDPEKGDGVFRIVIVGDSVVYGERIEDLESTFGKVLEKTLNQNAEGQSFETIHLARKAYTTQQELILLRSEVFDYQPDLVLLNYVLNDPLSPVYHPVSYKDPRYGYQSKWHQPASHAVSFVKKKFFYVWERWKGRSCPGEFHEFLHCTYRDQIEESLEEIATLSKEKNTPIVFVINPIYHRNAYREYRLSHLHERLAEMATGKGLVVYDILDAFRGHRAAEVGFCPRSCDVWHPNARGHELIAKFLYLRIKEDGYLKGG